MVQEKLITDIDIIIIKIMYYKSMKNKINNNKGVIKNENKRYKKIC